MATEQQRDATPRIATSPTGEFQYVPDEVIVFGEAARRRLGELDPEARIVSRGQADGDAWVRFDGVREVLTMVESLRAEGHVAQPNHVFWSHGCGHPCPPHPALAAHLLSTIAHPYSATPYSATPYSATPYSATPYSATPYSATPYSATRVPMSTARPARQPSSAARTLHGGGTVPVVVILDSGLASPRPGLLDGAVATDITGDDDVADDQIVDPAGVASGPDLYLDPVAGHGTFIAGLIQQIAPGTRVHVRKILEPLGDVAESTVVDAIDDALAGADDSPKPHLIGLSLGGPVLEQPFLLRAAIARAAAQGVLVVASAGNSGTCVPNYPAALQSVVAVAALGPGGPAPWSNYGDWVDACAPGTDLVSSFFAPFNGALDEINGVDPDDFDGWASWSGTSFAAPVLIAALAREMISSSCSAAEAERRLVRAPHLYRIPCFGTVVNV